MSDLVSATPTPVPAPATPGPFNTETLPESSRKSAIGGEDIRFNLTDLYSGIEDPQITSDLAQVERLYQEFATRFRGQLKTQLGAAMEAWEALSALQDKVELYVYLRQAGEVGSQEIQRLYGQVSQRISAADGDHFTFFNLEVAAIPETDYQQLLQSDARVQKYAPRIDKIREDAQHVLSEEIERALALRAPFGTSEWSEYVRERTAREKFTMKSDVFSAEDFAGKEISQEAIIRIINSNPSREVRSEALRIFNDKLAEERAPLMTRVLNLIAGKKNLEDRERKYPNVMSSRNRDNRISDAVVASLHDAVADTGAALCRRYYGLVASHLGVETLRWSDRNAPLSGAEKLIPWDEAVLLVKEAYRSFSPKLAELVDRIFDKGWVDAPLISGKRGGAFNMSAVLPEPFGIRSYVFLNYQGQPRDVSTLAHELGHAVHGIEAGQAQGGLMSNAPIAYCETASIFAEMVTFEFVKQRADSPQQKLTLLMEKISDFMGSVVRQISFSTFEQKLHEERKLGKLTTEQLNAHWLESTAAFYGKEGDVFTYQNADKLWSYVPHFMRPFYVYGYAFGELLTQSLYAVKESYGSRFEPLYLELLQAGGTKDAVELLKPFGLNPEDPAFWQQGMIASVGRWLDEAEALSREIGAIGNRMSKI